MKDYRRILTEVYRSEPMQSKIIELFGSEKTITLTKEEFEGLIINIVSQTLEMVDDFNGF